MTWRSSSPSPAANSETAGAGITFDFSYDSLVVSGSHAEYQGQGTVNGDGAFRFTVTIIDGLEGGRGGGHRFRIRIWDGITGHVLYDSQPGDPESADPAAVVEGGSIVIHDR